MIIRDDYKICAKGKPESESTSATETTQDSNRALDQELAKIRTH